MGNPVDEYLRIRKRADMWLERGPKLLEAAEGYASLNPPCSRPVGMAGSPVRRQWEDQSFNYGLLMRAIAACKEIGDA